MESIWLRPRRRSGSLLRSLLQHLQSIIDGDAQGCCGRRTTTQMCGLEYVHPNASAVWHQDVRGQFDLNSPIVKSPYTRRCRNKRMGPARNWTWIS